MLKIFFITVVGLFVLASLVGVDASKSFLGLAHRDTSMVGMLILAGSALLLSHSGS